jgi:tetratricopeptide (TPR) repeat protein
MSSDDRKVEGTTTIAVHLTIHEPVRQPGSDAGTQNSGKPPKPPRAVISAIALGDFHYDRGEYDDAITEYRRGLEADPSNGVLQTKMRRAQRAKEAEQRLAQ